MKNVILILALLNSCVLVAKGIPSAIELKNMKNNCAEEAYCREEIRNFYKDKTELLFDECMKQNIRRSCKLYIRLNKNQAEDTNNKKIQKKVLSCMENLSHFSKDDTIYLIDAGHYILDLYNKHSSFDKLLYYLNLKKEDYDLSIKRAINFYKTACGFENYNSINGCYFLSLIYKEGKGQIRKNIKLSKHYDDLSYNLNYKYQYQYGKSFSDNISYSMYFDAIQDKYVKLYKSAIERFSEYCKTNYKNSCVLAGRMYRDGKGARQDYKKAFEHFKKGCDHDKKDACFELAESYLSGKGARQDYKKAMDNYERSCNLDNEIACRQAGVLYFKAENYQDALFYFKRGGILDDGFSYGFIGSMYRYGQGVRQDSQKAKQYFGKACDLGLQLGCDEYAKLNR